MLRLKVFGQPLVERDEAPLDGAARQRRVLALLTVLAVGGARGVSRDRVLGLLWTEREPEKARQALTQALYHARKALAEDDLFFAGADLHLNHDVITTDVGEFEDAVNSGELQRAAALYTAPFLDGFHLNDAPEFERWATEERARLHARCTRALEQLARTAAGSSDVSSAAGWWQRLAALEPLNSRIAVELMHAMANVGDRAGAIRQATIHHALLREELDAAPNPAITALAERLRVTPVWTLPPHLTQTTQTAGNAALDVAPNDSAVSPAPPRLSIGLRRPWRRIGLVMGGVAALVAAGVLVTARWNPTRPARRAPAELLVVAPFRVAGADPALAYLREGLVDLLVTTLDEPSTVADPGAVLAAWRRHGFTAANDLTREQALTVARQLHGTRLVTGSVLGGPSRLVVTAALLTIPSGSVRAQVSADGPADSLTTIIDRLVAHLLVKEAGEWERLATHTSASPVALRAYLAGQAAYRRGSYREAVRELSRAIERDPTFALAGLSLATAADRINASESRARGLDVAWASRGELTERDSVYLSALAGPRYPLESPARDHLAAWERAAALMPDRSEVWHELGKRLFHDGQLLGIRDWSARSAAASRRASDLNPVFAFPLQYLVQLAASRNDTAAVRAAANAYLQLDSSGELSAFVRWRAAVALGDRDAQRAARQQFSATTMSSLRSIILSSLYNPIDSGDAERALAALTAKAARGAERADALLARHALSLNRGAITDAVEATERLSEDHTHATRALRLRVTDYLYAGADSGAAAAAVGRLARRLSSTPSPDTRLPASVASVAAAGDSAGDACVVGQWRAWTLTAAGPDTMQSLPVAGVAAPAPTVHDPCGTLIGAISASRSGSADAAYRAARLDSLLVYGAPDDELRDYGSLALARVYDALGDKRRALDAVRRRPHMRGWPHYLAAHLREEAALAAAVGDSAGSIAAYRHYITLRSSPEGAVRAEVAAARAELARLTPTDVGAK